MAQCNLEKFSLRSYVFGGILVPSVASLGLFGNSLCIFVLMRRFFKNSVYMIYLKALCVTDSLTLFASFFMIVFPTVSEYFEAQPDVLTITNHFIPVVYPIGLVAESISTWVVAVTSIVPILTVRIPFRLQFLNRPSSARAIVSAVCVMALLFNFPRLLELRVRYCEYQPPDNETAAAILTVVESTSLRQSQLYRNAYGAISYTVTMFALPFLVVIVANGMVLVTLMKSYNSGYFRRTRENSSLRKSELHVTVLIVAIACLFLFTRSLPAILNLLETQTGRHFSQGSEIFSALVDVSNFLVVVKASSNFLLFYFFNSRLNRRNPRGNKA